MFSTFIEQLKGYFGREFLLAAFLPTFVFTGASVALAFEVTRGLGQSFDAWEGLAGKLQVLSILGLLIFVTSLAYVLSNLQYGITRLFEGYWSRPLRSLRNWRAGFHLRRWHYLRQVAETVGDTEKNEIFAEQLAYYLPPTHLDKMMPTRLGNILRASEVYAYDRYGIDAAPIWTRLRQLLKPEATSVLEDRKLARDFMLLMSLLSGSFAVVWCTLLAIFTRRWDLFLACAAGWPLAWIFYQSAVQSSLAYGEQVRVIFDLHRRSLLEALGRPIPQTLEDERREWRRLVRFYYRNVPLPDPPAEPEAPSGWETLANRLSGLARQVTHRLGDDQQGDGR